MAGESLQKWETVLELQAPRASELQLREQSQLCEGIPPSITPSTGLGASADETVAMPTKAVRFGGK